MSGIYSVLFTHENAGSWITQVEHVIKRSAARGADGTKTVVLNGKFESVEGQLHARSIEDGAKHTKFAALLGCAYSQPIALSDADAGPFISQDGSLAVVYDGVISDYTGEQLVKWLRSSGDIADHWTEYTSQLDGQFALLAMSRSRPRRIYYAVKAKPLYALHDVLSRGTLIASSEEAFAGMYHAVRTARPLELSPYTSGYITLEGMVYCQSSLVRFSGEGTLVLSGGGLDTLVAAFAMKKKHPGERMELAYFDYGARARVNEYAATEAIARSLASRYANSQTTARKYDFPLLGQIAASNLTSAKGVVSTNPQAGRASEWVPGRNTVLMSLALSLAESYGYSRIVTGINPDAATAYPDNDSEWNRRMQAVVPYALGTDRFVRLEAPLGALSKSGIVELGAELKIPWSEALSWSCYREGNIHCGLCSSCRARRKAFRIAGVVDPTKYEVEA